MVYKPLAVRVALIGGCRRDCEWIRELLLYGGGEMVPRDWRPFPNCRHASAILAQTNQLLKVSDALA